MLEKIQTILFGGSMVVLLLGTGIYLTIKLRFFPVRAMPFILKNTVGTLLKKEDKNMHGGISPFQAVTTALAGTMGVGNIAGVATALVAGGPGAVFWMWISAFLGMSTKYAEIFLAVKYRQKSKTGRWFGGPMYYMEHGLGKKWVACIFALLCALCSFGIGNMTQINAVSSSLWRTFGLSPLVTGVVIAAVITLVIWGGVKRIAAVTEMVIPFISVVYIFCSGAFLWMHRDMLGETFLLIFRSAFSLKTAGGGVLGYSISQALRFGLSRGVFTNEAGLGSAPIAHAAAECKGPAHQGAWGVFEVFLDTIVVCTLTALVILTAQDGALWQSGLDGVMLTSAAFETAFGAFGGQFLAISILLFAVSGILGWYYYGESSLRYLAPSSKAAVPVYRTLYLFAIVAGAVSHLGAVWALSDALNALMAIPNICAILYLRRVLWAESP